MDLRGAGGMFLAVIKLEMDKVSREFLHSQESRGQDPIIICRAKKHIFLIGAALMCDLRVGRCSYMCRVSCSLIAPMFQQPPAQSAHAPHAPSHLHVPTLTFSS